MDSDQKTRDAQSLDPAMAARIVRSIADIERDATFAWGPLSERLMREAAGVMAKAAPQPWTVNGDEWACKLNTPNWKATRGVGQDAWLEIVDVVEDEEDHSWVAVFVAAGPTALGLELKFRPGLQAAAQTLTAKDKAVANVLKEGFELRGSRLIIPIAIDAEALAKGCEFNTVDEALEPLRRAVEIATTAKPDLDVLVEAVRTKGR